MQFFEDIRKNTEKALGDIQSFLKEIERSLSSDCPNCKVKEVDLVSGTKFLQQSTRKKLSSSAKYVRKNDKTFLQSYSIIQSTSLYKCPKCNHIWEDIYTYEGDHFPR